jgi:1,4-dihydroxy-2-naphthoyl-CoA hydrolase
MTSVTAPDISALMPLAATLGIELEASGPDEVRGRMAHKPELCTTLGVLHGGALMAFADTLGAVCASHHLPPGAMTTTIESKTNFLRAVTEGIVTGVSKAVHAGRRTIVVQTELRNFDGKLVALVTQTQAVIQGE